MIKKLFSYGISASKKVRTKTVTKDGRTYERLPDNLKDLDEGYKQLIRALAKR